MNSSIENSRSVPQLRFPEFIAEWKIKTLEEITIRGSGHTPSKSHSNYYNGGIKWVSLVDSKKLDNGYIEDTAINISEEGLKNSSAVLHREESVILSRDAGVGKSAILKTSMAVSQHFIVWYGKNEQLSNWFLYYKLQILKPEFERVAIGNTIKTIGLDYFKKMEIVIPTFSEQIKIASFLKELDYKIQALKKKNSLLEQYKKGVMQKLFSQKLRFKDENGNDFPVWEMKKLGEICEKQSSNISANKIEENFGDYIVYGAAGELKKVDFYEVEEDYISIVKDGAGVGRLLFCKGKSSVLGTLDIIKPLEKIDTYFLYCLLSNIDFTKFITGSTIPHIYFKDYKNEIMQLPCQAEQIKIANFLSKIDEKLSFTQQQIEKMIFWKKGILQKMFC